MRSGKHWVVSRAHKECLLYVARLLLSHKTTRCKPLIARPRFWSEMAAVQTEISGFAGQLRTFAEDTRSNLDVLRRDLQQKPCVGRMRLPRKCLSCCCVQSLVRIELVLELP